MIFSKNKSVVGLDIGSHSIKAVEVTRGKGRPKVVGFGKLEVGPDTNRSEAVAELLRRSKIHSKSVVSAVSGKSVIFRYVTIAQMTLDELRSAIRFEAEKYFPFDISEMELDCQILQQLPPPREGASPEMKVLLVGVKKSVVDDQAQLLIEAGLQPEIIDVDAFAVGNAFEINEAVSPTIEPGKPVALLDLGANKTSIVILSNGVSQFARELYVGGNDFTSAIGRYFNLETLEAENFKRKPETEEDIEKICKAIAPVLDELMNEVKLSIDFFEQQSDSPVDQICISGGGALTSYLEGAIERALERKCKSWNPFEGFEIDPERVNAEELAQAAPSLAVSVGLACRLGIAEVER